MKKIVQCVPNFSEGNNLQIIKKIIKPLQNKEGFLFIGYEPDKDYNRTVVTLLGDPEKMIEPLTLFYEKALKYIDMNNHKGQHPRMGAVDVTPFIPINNITIDECVLYSKKLAENINNKLNIPVFLYAESAQQKRRKNLPTIRRGEFEGMAEKLKDPLWKPDYGTTLHTTFGVTAIGARLPLIAYNIDLPTTDEKIANKIARSIRKSSGGFAYVQAGPAMLEQRGHTQVTMNILDYKKNPIYRVYETVKMEAKRYGLKVNSSEIIGLVPKDTLLKSVNYYLQVDNLTINNNISLKDLTRLAIKYLGLRDFQKDKIIESYVKEK